MPYFHTFQNGIVVRTLLQAMLRMALILTLMVRTSKNDVSDDDDNDDDDSDDSGSGGDDNDDDDD